MVHKIKSEKWERAGVVGVDSAQLLLADPLYLRDEIPSFDAVSGLVKHKRVVPTGRVRKTPKDWTPRMRANTAQILYKKGHRGAGVIVGTGWGDGEYPVYVLKGKTGDEKGRVKAVLVRFM